MIRATAVCMLIALAVVALAEPDNHNLLMMQFVSSLSLRNAHRNRI